MGTRASYDGERRLTSYSQRTFDVLLHPDFSGDYSYIAAIAASLKRCPDTKRLHPLSG